MKCEISQSPMISYQSLLFIATTMNDTVTVSLKNTSPFLKLKPSYSYMVYQYMHKL